MPLDVRAVPVLALLALPPLAIGAPPPPDDARFSPQEHRILTKRYVETTWLEVDSFEARVDGEPVQQDVPEARVEIRRTVAIADEYGAVADGRILALERAFDELAATTTVVVRESGGEEHEARSTSALEGALVRFEWDEDDGEYRRSFEEGGTGDDEHLDALAFDTDLTGFLPEGAVSEGDTWQVDPVHLGRVLQPSGDVRLIAADLGATPYALLDREAMLAALQASLGEAGAGWEGEIEATYLGRGEVDGTLGRIGLAIEVTAEVQLVDRLRRTMVEVGVEGEDRFHDLTLEWTLSAEAELAWDLEAGHARSFTLGGDVEADARLAYTERFFEDELEIEALYGVSGETTFELAVEG